MIRFKNLDHGSNRELFLFFLFAPHFVFYQSPDPSN